jgi:heptosyltransferase-3
MSDSCFSPLGSESNRQRVLIIFPGALGDLICLGPAMRALARRHRDTAIELMARGELARFAVGRLGVERGHPIERREVSLLFSEAPDAPARAGEFFAAFAYIYSFFGADNATCRRVLSEACPGVVGFYPFRPTDFGEGDQHVASAYLQSLGEAAEPVEAHINLREEDIEAASITLARHRLQAGKFILLMPGSGSPKKNWPPERFVELARLLPRVRPAAILLGPAEAGWNLFFADRGLPVLHGLELSEVAAIARMASAFVGNDSGVSHLAAAIGTPGVVLFGPTDPKRWRPLGEVKVLACSSLHDLQALEVAQALTEIEPGLARVGLRA